MSRALIILLAALAAGMAWADIWTDNFEKAQLEAKASGKVLLLNFSGSDWCGWCKKLDREVFSKNEFKAFARERLVPVVIDFPQRKAQSRKVQERNLALAKQYKVQGFPTILLVSAEGKVIARTGYRDGGPEPYVAHLKELLANVEPPQPPPPAGPNQPE